MDNLNPRYFLNNLWFRFSIVTKAKKETDIFLASDFNVFNYIRPDELILSWLISDLLNVSGNHGQQGLFLSAFLNALGKEGRYSEGDIVSIQLEKGTRYFDEERAYDGRIDIHISIDSNNRKFGIAIENKPWAKDQNQQIKRYIDEMEKSYDDFILVYLSKGHDPSEGSISQIELEEYKSKGLIKTWSYNPDLRNWLQKCRMECQSDKVRWYLSDFISYIDNKFPIYEGGFCNAESN